MGSGRGLPQFSGDRDDSEGDRPEEVSLEAARSDVHKQNAKEQAAKRRIASEAKATRRRQSQRRQEESAADPRATVKIVAERSKKEKSRKRKMPAREVEGGPPQPTGDDRGAAGNMGGDADDAEELLPLSVLTELAEKERLENLQRAVAKQQAEPRVKTKWKQAAKTAVANTGSDKVQVVVLGSEKLVATSFSRDAVKFQTERLYGSNRRRSHSMLAAPHQLESSFV